MEFVATSAGAVTSSSAVVTSAVVLGETMGDEQERSMFADLLECSVCLETLGSRHKVLPCQHTFCTRCLEDVRAKNGRDGITCPECRTVCTVPLEHLPSNVILNRILEGIGAAKRKSSTTSLNSSRASASTQHELNATMSASMSGSLSHPATPIHFGVGLQRNDFSRNALSPNADLFSMRQPVRNMSTASLGQQPLTKCIPGNPSTSPFLDLIESSSCLTRSAPMVLPSASATTPSPTTPHSPVPTLPPKPLFSGPQRAPTRPPPFSDNQASQQQPQTQHPNQQARNANGADSARARMPQTPSAGHQIYRALYEYAPAKSDELPLKRDELYVVVEKCQDGWFKGYSVSTQKSGVFPGNYVLHIQEANVSRPKESQAPSVVRAAPSSSGSGDLIDFSEFADFLGPSLMTSAAKSPAKAPAGADDAAPALPQPKLPPQQAGRLAPPPPSRERERFRCIMDFPASTQYELDLKEGDVVVLQKRREDGWCKGFVEKTGKSGLFPASFLQKL